MCIASQWLDRQLMLQWYCSILVSVCDVWGSQLDIFPEWNPCREWQCLISATLSRTNIPLSIHRLPRFICRVLACSISVKCYPDTPHVITPIVETPGLGWWWWWWWRTMRDADDDGKWEFSLASSTAIYPPTSMPPSCTPHPFLPCINLLGIHLT